MSPPRHLSTFFPALLAALACSPVPSISADAPEEAAFLDNGVTAHRGNSIDFPENTLDAFRAAARAGSDWIELDFLETGDGHLVVIHDTDTGRVGDRNLRVDESTYEELLAIDVGHGFRKRNGLTPGTCPPQRIPLLADVLRWVKTQQATRVSLQPKADCVDQAVALVKSLEAEAWVGFNDGNLDYMKRVKELAPEIPVFWDRGPSEIAEDVRIAREHGFEALVLRSDTVDGARARSVLDAGLELGAWTVNDPAEMQRLRDLGVRRVYTDDPRRALALADSLGYGAVRCDGFYPKHLQGVAADGQGALFWSFTDILVKTDEAGEVLEKLDVADHHGDLCYHDGRVWVAVNLASFNRPAGQADSWIYVYDAGSLEEVARHPTPEVVHGAGGMGWNAGQFVVVGGLPEGTPVNYLYLYDENLRFQRRIEIPGGTTRLGIQTAAFAGGRWWFGCYGDPAILLTTTPDFRPLGRFEFNVSLGITEVPDGRIFGALGPCSPGKGCEGSLRVLEPDPDTGLRVPASR